VVEVIDGDTYKLSNGEKVRLIGINTPELDNPKSGPEIYGMEAYEFIKPLLFQQEVKIKYDEAKRDKYQRLLVYMYLKDGTFVNAMLVEKGYARIMKVPPNVAYAKTFGALERQARAKKLGLWGSKTTQGTLDNNKKLPIKGNINKSGEKIYHLPGGRYYQQTKAEEYFTNEEEARKAGYRRAKA
jgi:micrococcal nuclease